MRSSRSREIEAAKCTLVHLNPLRLISDSVGKSVAKVKMNKNHLKNYMHISPIEQTVQMAVMRHTKSLCQFNKYKCVNDSRIQAESGVLVANHRGFLSINQCALNLKSILLDTKKKREFFFMKYMKDLGDFMWTKKCRHQVK